MIQDTPALCGCATLKKITIKRDYFLKVIPLHTFRKELEEGELFYVYLPHHPKCPYSKYT